MSFLRWGVIGMSDGNGHPYSWSAICNGYDPVKMAECGFSVIPEYLAAKEWPAARLGGVKVTHIWTQDVDLSCKIAEAARIEQVVTKPQDMLGAVDALLLARDDAENHLSFARPFLQAGLPVYIDKPIALSVQAFDEITALARHEAQIFTCSAMRYAKELHLTPEIRDSLGQVSLIEAVAPKAWDTYAVHVIDPVLGMLSSDDVVVAASRNDSDASRTSLEIEWSSGLHTRFATLGNSDRGLSIRVVGDEGEVTLRPCDTFSAFKSALADFKLSIERKAIRSPLAFNRRVVSIIELGRDG